jgi:hypothetical protein
VKCKFVVIIVWNILKELNFISTIWWPSCGNFFFVFSFNNGKGFYKFFCILYMWMFRWIMSFFQFWISMGTLKSIKSLSGWRNKDYKMIYKVNMKNCERRWIRWWPKVYSDNWTWKQINKLLKDEHKTIFKMERNMQGS